jgi:hypothetical protein
MVLATFECEGYLHLPARHVLHASHVPELPTSTSESRALAANKHALVAVSRGKRRPGSLKRPLLVLVEPMERGPKGKVLCEGATGLRSSSWWAKEVCGGE